MANDMPPDPLRAVCAALAEALVTQREALRAGQEDLVARLLLCETSLVTLRATVEAYTVCLGTIEDAVQNLTARMARHEQILDLPGCGS